MHSTPPDPLPQILKSRPDWASGVWPRRRARKELRVLWVAAAIMNTLGLPVGWMALFGRPRLARVPPGGASRIHSVGPVYVSSLL